MNVGFQSIGPSLPNAYVAVFADQLCDFTLCFGPHRKKEIKALVRI